MSYSISTLLTRNLHDVFGETIPHVRARTLGQIELGELNNSDLLHRNVNTAVMTLCR